MYVGVDIGGSKTLAAILDTNGVIVKIQKFATPRYYPALLEELQKSATEFAAVDLRAGCVAVPGRVDRVHGIGRYFGNLPWENVPLQADTEKIFHCPILLENDANLGGLSESMLLPKDRRVLYVTISTGIGTGLIVQQMIAPDLADSEGGQMLLDYHGKRESWEEFASGRAIVKRFGKKAADITDAAVWHRIAHDLAIGFIELIAVMQPDIIVVGGSVGNYFERLEPYLMQEIRKYPNPSVQIPTFQKAARPDLAVVYGCYDLARSRYGTSS